MVGTALQRSEAAGATGRGGFPAAEKFSPRVSAAGKPPLPVSTVPTRLRHLLILLLALLPLTLRAQNVAQGKAATASGTLIAGYPITNVNDGSVSTFTHPLEGTATTGFFYQIDLGQEYALHHLGVVNRSDGCCPERLTNYQLTLYADGGGVPGAVLWQATVRGDGSNSGIGGTDTVYASASTNPAHQFRGRFVRLTNLSGANANPQAAEIQAWTISANTNIALGRPVTASGALWPGLPASNLTDGQLLGTGTVAHPGDGVATLGFYFQTDLGAEYTLNRIALYNRSDCCPERLTNFRVTLYADNAGVPGAVLWQAGIRTDGSNSGQGGVDTILKTASTNPAYVFKGRFIRVENLSGAAYNPQIAEIEAYPEPPPTIRYFLTNAGNISGPGLPASATLSWVVENADTVTISGVGAVGLTGSTVVAPASTTTYTLTATRAGSASTVSSVVIAVGSATLAPKITEFQAADGLLEDENGDRPDWIEIQNPNAFTLNLAGFTLTDSALTPAKWTFPLANIAPGGYAVVFASGKDRRTVGSPLHTNFSLAASGEYLALFAPGGALVQQFPADYPATALFPKQYDRVSYGLTSAGAVKYFKPATPGAPNGASYDGVVGDTVFSVKRGIFSTPQTVAITTTTAGATIRSTTNSTEPTETTGTVYSAPLSVSATTTIRAAAFKTGLVPTNVDTQTYIFPADVVTSAVMSTTITQDPTYGPQMQAALTDLPSISIVTPATIVDGTSVLCSFEYIPASGVGVHENAGVELFGGAYTNFQKKSFRLVFKSDFGATNVNIPDLFAGHERGWKPVTKFDSLDLRSGSHDMAQRGFYMSNPFTDGTMLDMGNLNPHSRFVHLYLNGTYWGMFHLRERWDADMHTRYLGGPASDYESINGNLNVGGWADPGSPYDGDGSSWTRVKSLRADFAGVSPYLAVRHYTDYMLMFCFGNSEDEYRIVSPKNVGSGFKFLLNDADGFLATAAYLPNVPANRVALRSNPSPGRQNGDGPGSIFSQLWQQGHADYKMLLADRIHKLLFNGGPLTAAANQARLSGMCLEIQRAFYAESARWVASGESRTPATWAGERDNILNNWFPGRSSTYLSQLQALGYYPGLAAPAFGGGTIASGTNVSFPVAGATVYYTTDGSDPRLPGGAISPTTFIGTSTMLTANTWLRARAKSGATWSALNEAFYTVTTPLAPGDIVFSEIHYNAQGDDDAEFIELWNPTTHAVNLRGAKFTAGLSYDFPGNRDIPLAPGGRLVLVASQYAFQLRYGIGIPVAGVYFDRLGNDGDTLTLATSANTTLISLHYDDLAPWPETADGNGYSLVLANAAAPTAATSWRTSTALNGNPGASDATTFTGTPLADADGDGVKALTEHFLATSDTNSASGVGAIVAGRAVDGRATLTFPRRLSADDLTYVVEVSADLAAWSTAATRTAHVNNGNGTATETWTASSVVTPQFMRLRVTKP